MIVTPCSAVNAKSITIYGFVPKLSHYADEIKFLLETAGSKCVDQTPKSTSKSIQQFNFSGNEIWVTILPEAYDAIVSVTLHGST